MITDELSSLGRTARTLCAPPAGPLFLVWPFVPAELSVSTIAIALTFAATSLAIGGAAAHSVFARPLSSAGGVQ